MKPHITVICLINCYVFAFGFQNNFQRKHCNGCHLEKKPLHRFYSAKETVVSDKPPTNTQRKSFPCSARSIAAFSLMSSHNKKKPEFAIRQLENDPDFLLLESRDRAFARLLLSTVERRQGQIDKVITAFMKSNKGQKQKAVDRLCQAALRIGVAQLLFLDVAKHAALKETVEVLRMHPKIKVS